MRTVRRWVLALSVVAMVGCSSQPPQPAAVSTPPEPPREFRAAWVAAVSNIDWPSRPGLSTDEQLREMGAILDRAVQLKLNALIVQVRPACDALYASPYEPWSEYLTGQQGKAPQPMYDPLATWVQEAHKRGIELHAWFNPYRARHFHAKTPDAPNHIANVRPDLVRKFNGWEWCDPGEPDVRKHTLAVIVDVVKRYDIDGVHIDDYFYPYAEYLKGADFPDEPSWQKYRQTGGTLSRADWRRDNVNRLVRGIYDNVKNVKPWVKFGVSPFGIWRPNNPAGVTGLDAYEKLYADARLWINQGWVDYINPQLYWPVTSKGQPFVPLLQWWIAQNPFKRHIWPGLYTSQVNREKSPWPVSEILEQVRLSRVTLGAGGTVHFSMKALTSNYAGVADALRSGPYSHDALLPASPWIAAQPNPAPTVQARRMPDGTVDVRWQPQAIPPRLWGIWTRTAGQWSFSTALPHVQQMRFNNTVEAIGIIAIDRLANTSPPAMARF